MAGAWASAASRALRASAAGWARRTPGVRWFAATPGAERVCERFTKQFRLPGRTTGVLSSGVVPYPNDPMVPQDRYFKPKGLEQGGAAMTLLLRRGPHAVRVQTPGFQLLARPWDADEHPRDHNGLRYRDYRVAIIASKKSYSKRAHLRWRIIRLLRTAASLVLPDKGQRRCDYLFFARPPLQKMDRDELFLAVEHALVDVRNRIRRRGTVRGPADNRSRRPAAPSDTSSTHEAPGDGDGKILNVDMGARRPVHCVTDIVEELVDYDGMHRTG